MKIVCRILEALMVLFALAFLSSGDIFEALIWLLLAAGVEQLYRSRMRDKAAQRERQDAHWRRVQAGEEASFTEQVKHISGLPLAQEASCRVEVYAQELRVLSAGSNYKIPMTRIRGAELIDSKSTSFLNGGGVGRAIVWSFLAGPAAGVVAGASKTKRVDTHRYFTCIYYESKEGADACLVFENQQPVSYVDKRSTSLVAEIKAFASPVQREQTL